jgi:hypothetical protein
MYYVSLRAKIYLISRYEIPIPIVWRTMLRSPAASLAVP